MDLDIGQQRLLLILRYDHPTCVIRIPQRIFYPVKVSFLHKPVVFVIDRNLLTDYRFLILTHPGNVQFISKSSRHGDIAPRLKRRDPAGLVIGHRAYMGADR